MRWKIKCNQCNKEVTFADAKDIIQSHWTVLAWVVPSGEPPCVCPDCEHNKPKKSKK